ncbi:hypothetical protein A3K48_03470 [candidate division WOR-1 bacterium RIFOXYA12_FULL_52_29]|uniref:YprB ribonuclease H-like domain-containing protein n=1 Tax=candidate division WOR-1 bacterium RIFOXYC12_FULL_54_18 TaxID=1802584 RepID=A0A1F4T5K6_UNCSA|nr:MAG: hypothetical protein A3K44_03470 [candidate division WOR-1 bacterium RIFOXYA2_FULL_51_19]OGC17625.1 MAG: hypothetical protein A3K48_03470 [candidate division WOR-1 bacterium RIFOXYA12_FULL_52_29]OGC26482.1 MAG: hypothetical protein A3K32_03465 [candidate division WOR-1 bacterium RIFOXYB2_FULL_45_9]OGC28042.1 MAG: hypothetical protein A3K49_03470 [candidate division WOR-1 bacterium RIFOXYC12_FULL_54_18]OGC29672.1 MAG: hypothetical protein A2346_02865 [candidate division WOR-1 bacterium R
MKHITAQDLYNYVQCPYRVYLDENGDPSQKGKVSSFVELLWDSGLRNEKEVINSIGMGNITEVNEVDNEQAFRTTLKLMNAGAPIIYHGCLMKDNMLGIPDLLIKKDDHASNMGNYYYEAVEIKSGKGAEDERTNRFKKHYAYQVIFYDELLFYLQGYMPKNGKIINGSKEVEEFSIDSYRQDFLIALDEVIRLKTGPNKHEPIISSKCSSCVWEKICKKWANDNNDPTLIFFVGKNKYLLKARGLNTVDEIAAMDTGKYLKEPFKMKGLAAASLERMKKRAQVLIGGKPQIYPGYSFPSKNLEVYFDIEDDPTQELVYLFGLYIVEKGKKGGFQYFVAREPNEEEATIRAFWEFIKGTEEAVYYVYSSKERSTLKRLMQKYHLDEGVFNKYVDNEYDLYTDLIVKYSDWPTYSYGLKQIAKIIGFKWRDEDPSGANSIAWYNQYLKGKDDVVMQRILDYNEDDCKATFEVKKYFQQVAGCEGGSGPR